MLSRLAYRTRQFWYALPGTRKRVETEALLPHLSPIQIVLFRRMQASEQAHAFQVLKRLEAAGQTDPDLLTAALLHDVGKVLFPISIRRPFVVAAHHPEWGADLAEQAFASPRIVELIRRHQDFPAFDDQLLVALQAADDKN
jgi:hypothetical protein